MNTSKIEYNGSKVRLWKLNPGAYLGRVRDYNIKTSKRTNKSYINLELDLLVDGQKVDVVKSYCLSMGSNYLIISLMKAAMTSINGVARSADLIDRSCLIILNRFKKSEIKTETNVMTSFQKDLPLMLGAIFNTIAIVLADRKKVRAKEKIRLADFHEKAIKIGRALEIEEDRITDILFRNRMELSLNILESSSIAMCMKILMEDDPVYTDTPTNCLNQLRMVAKREGIDISTLPKDAARLTKALILIKDELNSVYGIDFNQKRGKERQYVIRNNNLETNDSDIEE